MKDIICRYAFSQETLIWSFLRSNLYLFWTLIILCNSDETGFLSDFPSLMLGIAIRCIQHSQARLEHEVCELAHSFFHSNRFNPYPISFQFVEHIYMNQLVLRVNKFCIFTNLILTTRFQRSPTNYWAFAYHTIELRCRPLVYGITIRL